MRMDMESRRTVRLSGKLTGVNRPPARCEDVIFVTSSLHMSMESSFETQFYLKLTQNTTFQTPIPRKLCTLLVELTTLRLLSHIPMNSTQNLKSVTAISTVT